jgi:hypothetical protein
MTPESTSSGARVDVHCYRLGKEVPTEMNTQATIEEVQFQCNGEVNIPL